MMDELAILRRQQKAEREKAREKERRKNSSNCTPTNASPRRSCNNNYSLEDRQKRIERLRLEERMRNAEKRMEKHGYIRKRNQSEENSTLSPRPKKIQSLEADNGVPSQNQSSAPQHISTNEKCSTPCQGTAQTAAQDSNQIFNSGSDSSDIDDATIFQMAKAWRCEVPEKQKDNGGKNVTNDLTSQSAKGKTGALENNSNGDMDEMRPSGTWKGTNTHSSNVSEDTVSSHLKQSRNESDHRNQESFYDGDDDDDDLYAYSKRFGNAQHETERESSDDSYSRYLRTSKKKCKKIVSAKGEDRNEKENINRSSAKIEKRNIRRRVDDDFWDDSSADESKNSEKLGRTRRRKERTTQGCISNYDGEILEADADLKLQLKPDFNNPKMGKPSALVQYILERNVGEEIHYDYVPASINRYLQEYQQKAISWMHALITTRKGCILGDDMGTNQFCNRILFGI